MQGISLGEKERKGKKYEFFYLTRSSRENKEGRGGGGEHVPNSPKMALCRAP
jgi:hypothetical protein